MKMTFEEYDKEVERFNQINVQAVYPTFRQIEMFKKDPDKWLLYACYILEKADEPVTNEERYSKKNLIEFVNSNLELE